MTVSVRIGGLAGTGWTEITVRRALDELSASAELVLVSGGSGPLPVPPPRNGLIVEIKQGFRTAFLGTIDEVERGYGARGRFLRISARDGLADLVDCAAAVTPSAVNAGFHIRDYALGRTWQGKVPLGTIANDLCAPLGASASIDPAYAGTLVSDFAVDMGETAAEALERLARMKGLMLRPMIPGEAPGLSFAAPPTLADPSARLPAVLKRGVNILDAKLVSSLRRRHSHYFVTAHGEPHAWLEGGATLKAKGWAHDPDVPRFRPHWERADEENAAALKLCEERARWEAATRYGRAVNLQATVAGWSPQAEAPLWEPGWFIQVEDDWLDVRGPLLIAATELSLSAEGTRAQLDLCPPEAFQPAPLGGGVKTHPWSGA